MINKKLMKMKMTRWPKKLPPRTRPLKGARRAIPVLRTPRASRALRLILGMLLLERWTSPPIGGLLTALKV
eukprot:8409577-Pyramimonas_sp.AAC.1